MKSYQRFFLPVLVLAAGALGAGGMWAANAGFSPPPSASPLVSLERMGDLVSVRLNYSNVIEFVQPRTVGIPWTVRNVPLGGTKVLLVAKGDCTVATKVQNAQYEHVGEKERTLTVVLPAPTPFQARISHETKQRNGSYLYAITQHGPQLLIPGAQNTTAAVNGAFRRAQDEVDQACKQPAVLAMAKENAESVLGKMFAATGWKARFVWK